LSADFRAAELSYLTTRNLQTTRSPEGVTQMLTGPFDRVLAQALRRSLEVPCLTVDPELFFAESPEDVETAKAMCAECPVRTACLTAALDRQEPWGVWGAELFVQGAIVARKRPRGRPRKEVAA
jgi:WhiB family transcriptional regulator, redox-sensing transcriptional regulator